MFCFNNGCNRGNNLPRCRQAFANENNFSRTYATSPYPVYPPYPYPCQPNNCCPQIRAVDNGCCCNQARNNQTNGIFKAVTLGNEEVFQKGAVPFNFNAFGEKRFIDHYPHDNNFKINEDGLYHVVYKLNFTPSHDGAISFVLRQNGTPINETLVIIEADTQKYSSVTFDDYLKLERDSIIDLQLVENGVVSAVTIVNPYIIFEHVN